MFSTYESLTRQVKHHGHLLNQFTSQWRWDYLINLRENHFLNTKAGGRHLIQQGDVVLLKCDTSKRLFWKLAIVKDLLECTDGRIRAAVVKVPDPRGGVKLLRRSIKHLHPIEVRPEEPPLFRHLVLKMIQQQWNRMNLQVGDHDNKLWLLGNRFIGALETLTLL